MAIAEQRGAGNHHLDEAETGGIAAFVGSSFRPSKDGFSFVNRFLLPGAFRMALRLSGGGDQAGVYGLCGGMSFLAADHFLHEVHVPDATTEPGIFQSLYWSIFWRQLASLNLQPSRLFRGFAAPVWKYRAWMRIADEGPGSIAERTTAELEKIMSMLAGGELAPLGLVCVDQSGSISRNHQVLAYGFRRRSPSITDVLVYDPSIPRNDEVVLEVRRKGSESRVLQRIHNCVGPRPVRGFFVSPFLKRKPSRRSVRRSKRTSSVSN